MADTTGAEKVSEQLGDVWSALIDLGRELTSGQWDQPTSCPGWTVRDQYSHMIGTESMLAGRPLPGIRTEPGSHVLNSIGEFNELWVEEWRGRSGTEVLAEFQQITEQRLAAIREMSQEALEAPSASPVGTVPYRVFMDVRTMDCWIHEQDVREAMGLPWRFAGASASVAADRLAMTFPFAVGKKVKPADGTVIRMIVEGALARELTVKMESGRAIPVADARPDVDLRSGSRSWVMLSTGRITAGQCLELSLLSVDGDLDLGMRVASNLNQMP